MLKIKIHPLFFIYAIILVLQNKYVYLLSSLFCIIIHEWSHFKVAYNLGYCLDTLNIMPYGAMLSGADDFTEKDGLKIAFAGPLSNIILCLILLATWWIFPVSYSFTKSIFDASITLAFFNLIPLFPLDGSKIILVLSKNSNKTLAFLKAIGFAISGVLYIIFLISFFYTPNLNLGITSAIVYVSTISSSNKESYKKICDICPYVKRLDLPLTKKTLMVHQDLKIIRLLKHINAGSQITFEIVDDNLNLVKSLSENELKKIAVNSNLQSPIKEFLYL